MHIPPKLRLTTNKYEQFINLFQEIHNIISKKGKFIKLQNSPNTMGILVTGGAEFIGSHLVDIF
jgi:hypothetical protein|tara:strand:+ start:3408 stop:3599 length:192 start_codon:yes stop_codon:yes gene_type:complete